MKRIFCLAATTGLATLLAPSAAGATGPRLDQSPRVMAVFLTPHTSKPRLAVVVAYDNPLTAHTRPRVGIRPGDTRSLGSVTLLLHAPPDRSHRAGKILIRLDDNDFVMLRDSGGRVTHVHVLRLSRRVIGAIGRFRRAHVRSLRYDLRVTHLLILSGTKARAAAGSGLTRVTTLSGRLTLTAPATTGIASTYSSPSGDMVVGTSTASNGNPYVQSINWQEPECVELYPNLYTVAWVVHGWVLQASLDQNNNPTSGFINPDGSFTLQGPAGWGWIPAGFDAYSNDQASGTLAVNESGVPGIVFQLNPQTLDFNSQLTCTASGGSFAIFPAQ